MKNILRQGALRLILNAIALLRFIRKPNSGTIFLAPDIPISNLGDQALLLGAVEGLKQQGCGPIYVVANGPENISQIPMAQKHLANTIVVQDLNVMFATHRAFKESIKFYWLASKVKSIVLVGADVLDGRYNSEEAGRKLAIIGKCIDLGLFAKIVGFSLSDDVSNVSAEGFKRLANRAEFISRDPVSQKRMEAFSPCKLGADCAFLMQPSSLNEIDNTELVSWINRASFPVALCLRDEDFMTESTEALLEGFVTGLIAALESCKGCLLLIPHHPVDIQMLTKVAQELDKQEFKRYFLITQLPSAQNIKTLVKHCEHIITSRMHVAIASLGMGRAITCLPYAGKFEGLYQHFSLTGAGLDRELIGDATYMEQFLSKRFRESANIREHISQELTKVVALSRSNFDDL